MSPPAAKEKLRRCRKLQMRAECFFDCLGDVEKISVTDISFDKMAFGVMNGFAQWMLEAGKCKNSSANQRLSRIWAFCRRASLRKPACGICCNEVKSAGSLDAGKGRQVKFFSEDALQAILEQPDASAKIGWGISPSCF
ncbi:MAG: hypothetical protein LBU32_05965 [Clostridiales bacterium]|jgi:hypothetical protein|nr:hypothetical protein [Clostridiales bacterium]